MSVLSFKNLPTWAFVLALAVHFGVGVLLGLLHFRALWWNTRRVLRGAHPVATAGVMIGRFVLLGAVLYLASREGALPLLATALGVLLARSFVTRRVERGTS